MTGRILTALSVAMAVAALAPMPVVAQPDAEHWTLLRTPWGDPDIQGVWSFATITPLERPLNAGAREELTGTEVDQLNLNARTRNDRTPRTGSTGTYNAFWWDRGESIGRTSLIIDPADGRIPRLTPEGQARVKANDGTRMRRSTADSWEDRPLAERCIQYRPLPRLPTGYNNHYQIFQTPGFVVLLTEMIHHVRVIPIDGRPHIDLQIRLWNGDSRGHWEGDTLVVETTNFSDKTSFRGSGANLHLVERFTRTGPERVAWEFTVEDATTWRQPWTGGIPFRRVEGPLYEYACHEGNYAMTNMLKGYRASEQATAAESETTGRWSR